MNFVSRDDLADSQQGVESGARLSSFEKRQEKVRLLDYFNTSSI